MGHNEKTTTQRRVTEREKEEGAEKYGWMKTERGKKCKG